MKVVTHAMSRIGILAAAVVMYSTALATNGAQFQTPWQDKGTQWEFTDRSQLLEQTKAFFGGYKGYYIVEQKRHSKEHPQSKLLADQFSWAFSGETFPEAVFQDGNHLFAATQTHNVGEFGLVLTDGSDSGVLAVGVFHCNCLGLEAGRTEHTRRDAKGCDTQPTLSIFYSGRIAPSKAMNADIISWATKLFQRRNSKVLYYPKYNGTFLVEVRWINHNNG